MYRFIVRLEHLGIGADPCAPPAPAPKPKANTPLRPGPGQADGCTVHVNADGTSHHRNSGCRAQKREAHALAAAIAAARQPVGGAQQPAAAGPEPRTFHGTCFHCGKRGHRRDRCPDRDRAAPAGAAGGSHGAPGLVPDRHDTPERAGRGELRHDGDRDAHALHAAASVDLSGLLASDGAGHDAGPRFIPSLGDPGITFAPLLAYPFRPLYSLPVDTRHGRSKV